MKSIAFAVVLLFSAVAAKAADHTVRLQVNCGGASMGWHFSQYYGRDNVPISELASVFEISLPGFIDDAFGRSKFHKIRNMDDSAPPPEQKTHGGRMQRGDQFDETFQVQGPGIFIFDVSDWSNDCNIEAAITVDGQVWFGTSSYALDRHSVDASNLRNWHNTLTPYVRQTDDREIAFALN